MCPRRCRARGCRVSTCSGKGSRLRRQWSRALSSLVNPKANQNAKTGQANPTLARAARSGQLTEDEKLLRSDVAPNVDFTSTDPWRVLRMTGELIAGIDSLSHVGRAVSIFGSARVKEGSPYYEAARYVGKKLAEAKYAVITGGGPGIMEAANRGAEEG